MAGGLTKGKSHAKGGIKMKVKSTGQNIEVEGGEGIINKHTMSSKDKHTFEGKEMTACEIASELNQKTGNGVSFDCDETKNTDMTPTDPTTGFAKGGKTDGSIKWKKNISEDGYTIPNYDFEGGYISEDGNYKIYQEVKWHKEGYSYRGGYWTAEYKEKPLTRKMVYGNQFEDEYFWFPTLKEAKQFVNQHEEKQFSKGGKPKRKYKKKKMAKSKKKTGAFGKLVSKIMKRDDIPYKQALAKAKDEYVSGATSQKKQPKKSYKGRLDKLKSKSAPKKSYSGRPKKAQGGKTDEVYLVQVGWKQLNQPSLGEFVLSQNTIDKLEDEYGYTYYFDLYDDSNKKPISYSEMASILDKSMKDIGLMGSNFAKGGEVGKTALKKNIEDVFGNEVKKFVKYDNNTDSWIVEGDVNSIEQTAYMQDIYTTRRYKGAVTIPSFTKDDLKYPNLAKAQGGELMDADTQVDYAKGGEVDYKLVTKFTDIDYDKRTATIKRLFVGITNDNELYFLNIGDRGAKDFSITGDEVFGITEDDAINQTKETLLDLFNSGEGDLSYISSDYYDVGDHFQDILEESMESYVDDIMDDEERFIEELVDAGIVTQEAADDGDVEEARYDYRDRLVEYYVGLEDAEDWFKMNFGEQDYNLQIVNNNLIDFEAYLDDQDLIYDFDNSTLPEYIEVDGVDYVFGASSGGQNRDTLDDLKVSFLPTKILNLIRVNWDDYHLSTLPESMFFPEIEQDEDEILEYYIKNLDRYAKGGQTKKFNNGGNIMDKKLELAKSLSSQVDIDFEYLDWDEINSFDELEEAVDNNGFFQQEVIYYATAMDYLREEDPSLREALELAGDMGYDAGSLNSEILASILKSERVRESFYELRSEVDDFFDELED